MESQDELEKKFHDTFRNLSKEPPPEVWENIRRMLHPEPKPLSPWEKILFFPRNSPGIFRYSAIAAAASLLIFLAVVYFGTGGRHVVRGHAYAGDTRLCRGTAFLFIVKDKVAPFDSVEHYRSAVIDEQGFYSFPRITNGRYLLRISPAEGSEVTENYQASWFDQHESPDSAHLVIVGAGDVNADVHLLKKNN